MIDREETTARETLRRLDAVLDEAPTVEEARVIVAELGTDVPALAARIRARAAQHRGAARSRGAAAGPRDAPTRSGTQPSARMDGKPSAQNDTQPTARSDAEPSARSDAEPSVRSDAEPSARSDAEPPARTTPPAIARRPRRRRIGGLALGATVLAVGAVAATAGALLLARRSFDDVEVADEGAPATPTTARSTASHGSDRPRASTPDAGTPDASTSARPDTGAGPAPPRRPRR